jgi:hypothetical protein
LTATEAPPIEESKISRKSSTRLFIESLLTLDLRLYYESFTSRLQLTGVMGSDKKFPEIFTGGKFPETFPTMFAHRFLVAYFFNRFFYVTVIL